MKSPAARCSALCLQSPSTRREWIEITAGGIELTEADKSPSTRREWIEISSSATIILLIGSPSTRREWIEMKDWLTRMGFYGLPPHGGSGLKSIFL